MARTKNEYDATLLAKATAVTVQVTVKSTGEKANCDTRSVSSVELAQAFFQSFSALKQCAMVNAEIQRSDRLSIANGQSAEEKLATELLKDLKHGRVTLSSVTKRLTEHKAS